MHELAIAGSVLEIACRRAQIGDAPPARVTVVSLKVGHLRQVVPTSLLFSFELISQGTVAEGAKLEIESVPAVGVCRACGAESRLEAFPLQCRVCNGFDLRIIAGEELIVESLELEEKEIAANT